MQSNFEKVKGYMKIEQIDDEGNVIDVYEDDNLIMNSQRSSMQFLQGNIVNVSHPINAFRIGTLGTLQNNPGEPKKPGTDLQQGEYHPEMEGLFQQESQSGGYVYECKFNVQGANSLDHKISSTEEVMWFQGNKMVPPQHTPIIGEASIQREATDRVITFQIDLPKESANPPPTSGLSRMAYSEAALYCGYENSGRIFSMKTFPTKYKDDALRLLITWSIIF